MRSLYVSSLKGDDHFDGFSPDRPLKTLSALMKKTITKGHTIYLERGSVFENEYLHLNVTGTATCPILITDYGDIESPLPVINANGNGIWYQDYGGYLDNKVHVYKGYVSSAVLLYDCSHIKISNIEITNSSTLIGEEYSQADKMDRTGVAIIAKDKGACTDISLEGLIIHDVDGNVYDKHMANGGIYACALKPEDEEKTGIARFKNLFIRNCTVYNVSRWGIAAAYSYRHADYATAYLNKETFFESGNLDIVIENCTVAYAGGDAITAMYAYRPLIINCTALSCASEMNDRVYKYPLDRLGKVAAAIWSWKCLDSLITHNFASDTRLNQDGMAYDADSGDHAVYKRNFSYMNEGGAMMICLEEAVNTQFIENISFDDLSGTINPASCPNGHFEGNTFYVREGIPFERSRMCGGSYTEKNNKTVIIKDGDNPSELLK